MTQSSYGQGTLQASIRSRMMEGVNGLDVHILESGFETPGRPLALLVHGFPDLAYGWRDLMPLLADAGYHVVAPDQRGFGRTTGWVNDYDTPLAPFSLLNSVRDAVGLTFAMGYQQTAVVVGHDFGSPIASYCALIRPDVFPALVLLSAPFPGPPSFPLNTAIGDAASVKTSDVAQKLAAALEGLDPPRALHQHYLATRGANDDLSHPAQGLHEFLRTFFYVKSGDWPGNDPHPIDPPTAEAFASLPTYYIMEQGKTMSENIAPFRPSPVDIEACDWLTEAELAVYVEEYGRAGFQGGLQTYRIYADPTLNAELRLFSGRTIDVPSLFVAGNRDWAPYVAPGAIDLMAKKAMTKFHGTKWIDGAGHWIQQERPRELSETLMSFLREIKMP
jgi:pimeloyl-ACP methyl ester carboxylesterase